MTDVFKVEGSDSFELKSLPSNQKKITGTRFSKILGLNPWATPFQAWCEIYKVAEPPFEGNKYTEAGQVIEPKLIDYCRSAVSPYIVDPKEYYHDNKRRYDFFPTNEVLGGMWDALAFDRPNCTIDTPVKPIAVIECKTSSRPQDWEYGIPDHYKAQGMLYAWLLGVEDVYFPVAFLQPQDYEHPELFMCTDENTRLYHIKTDDMLGGYNGIQEAIYNALGIKEDWDKSLQSPAFDARKDKDYLKLIRTSSAEDLGIDTNDLDSLCASLLEVDTVIEQIMTDTQLDEWKKKRSALTKSIGEIIKDSIDGGYSVDTTHYVFDVSTTQKVNYDALKADGLYDKYVSVSKSMRTKRKEQ